MGATYSPRPELVFPDPFDTIRAAMPGAKLAAEADAIILALEQILSAIIKWKEVNWRLWDNEDPFASSAVDIGYNIMQLSQILNSNVWGEFSGDLYNYLRRKFGRAPTKAEMAAALDQMRKAQIADWKRQLKALLAIRNPSPAQKAMIEYLKRKLGGR